MAFETIHTNAGLNRIASAEATGTTINLVAMAVGDGNGNPVTPVATQTALVREVYRHAPNRIYQDPTDSRLITAELVVPASVSGFTMREVACFDADGTMLVVGNLPDTYKPNTSEGAYADAVVRVQFYVSNAAVVTLVLDPSVTMASQQWVINNMTPAALIPGGTTGQMLVKHSNADGDFEWQDPTDVNVVVNMVPETQTLAAGQTSVTLSTVTTNGLAVYVEGARLRADQWTAVDATHLTLATSYPAGTKFEGVQNEPAGTLVYPLSRDSNLSDLPNKATARANLDVYSKAEVDARTPVGIVDHYSGSTPPPGWLVRDGSAISRTVYAALFAVIGTSAGAGDGVNTFNLPDDRANFDRGVDAGRGIDNGRAMLSEQGAYAGSFTVTASADDGDGQTGALQSVSGIVINGVTVATNGAGTATVTVTPGDNRPRNRAYLPIIKY